MKIALINGSPRHKDSASAVILQMLKRMLAEENEILELYCATPAFAEHDLKQITSCDRLVFSFPLYVDAIPSHLLRCLSQLEEAYSAKAGSKPAVYALVNCGFYEGSQNSVALDIIKNWCHKAGPTYGQGIGMGGGGMLLAISGVPDDKGPKRIVYEAIKTMANNILAGASADNLFVSPGFPRFAYKLSAEFGWRKAIKENGLKVKDLSRRM